ncbi:MAG: prepilin peptidase [Nitrospirota bacterium]|nr:prepilin peptidase [Nitrospirota bacterium]
MEFGINAAAFLFGLAVGSFLNVCIYRLPKQESVVFPASHCPGCGSSIRWHDNIPVLSYLVLGGRCRHCKASISWQYPMVELATGVLFFVAVAIFGVSQETPVYLLLLSALIVIAVIDLEHQIIPDRITLPGIPLGLICSTFLLPTGLVDALIGLAAGGGGFYLIAVISRGGMGGGDIKLMAMLGAFLGWKAIIITTLIGSLMGAIVGIFLMAVKGRGRKHAVPFGPFLATGALVALFWGEQLVTWYTGFQL